MPRVPQEFRAAVRRLTKSSLALDKKSTRMPLPDHTRNAWGHYWSTPAVESHLANLRAAASLAPDDDERAAALYSMAAFMNQALMLDEAEATCAEIAKIRSATFPPTVRLLAEISARRGDMSRALLLAKSLEQDPAARVFRISEADLQAIFSAGQRRAP
jgi:hypothetical protein